MLHELELDIDYNTLREQGTGSHSLIDDTVTFVYPFDRYEVKIRLTSDGRFLGIEEIKVNKDFLDHIQKMIVLRSIGYEDVEKYYRDEEE